MGQLKFIVQEAMLGTESELAFRSLAEPCGSLNQYHRAVLSVLPHSKMPITLQWGEEGECDDFPTTFCDSFKGVTLSYMNAGRNSPEAKVRENMKKKINK